MEAPMRENLPVLLGLLGVWNSTFLGHACKAILPYSQALVRFPAHIQQVDMESNGKRVRMDGSELDHEAGEIILGEPGTNGQHSFYQLMHQGRCIPAEFIGFCKSQVSFPLRPSPSPVSVNAARLSRPTTNTPLPPPKAPVHLPGQPVSNHDELMSNFFAQPDALATGKTLAECEREGIPEKLRPHKEFKGDRPSVSILMPQLDAYNAGVLLALYEHRVAVQGFVWGINSFDQWGVELGKSLAKKIRAQLQAGRAGQPVACGNPSTDALLQMYLAQS